MICTPQAFRHFAKEIQYVSCAKKPLVVVFVDEIMVRFGYGLDTFVKHGQQLNI